MVYCRAKGAISALPSLRFDVSEGILRAGLHDVLDVAVLAAVFEAKELLIKDEDVRELEALALVPGHEKDRAL